MTNDSLRTQYARYVMARCNLDGAFAGLFPIRDAAGRRVIVPLLETDSVQLAVRLIQQAGGEGSVTVLRAGERWSSMVVSLRVHSVSPSHNECDLPVGPDCTFADVLKVLTPGVSVSMTQAEYGELRIADVADSDSDGLVLR